MQERLPMDSATEGLAIWVEFWEVVLIQKMSLSKVKMGKLTSSLLLCLL
jgi:hypothetical protein